MTTVVTDKRITCSKCGRDRRPAEFFILKNGEYCEMCKDCLCMYIDNQKLETFSWILEKFDVPYVEKIWIKYYNEAYKKDPSKIGPRSVIGKYLRTMKMTQYKDFGYADSDKLNFKDQQNAVNAAITQEKLAELEGRLERGEISQAEFDTFSASPEQVIQAQSQNSHFITNVSQENENKIIEQLSEEDYQYLLLKWGELYRPSQWVRLEELYDKYESEYELNVDREDALKKICKVSLKIDEALDIGDIAAVDKLQRTYDTLRKSAKFTEAQNKEDKQRELDSIGELVAFIEREGGIIPQFEDPIEYPKDKVDFIIKDIQNYINNLVRDELGLGNIIEAYIQKLEQSKSSSVEEIIAEGFDKNNDELTAEDIVAFSDFQANEIEQEAKNLLESFEE